MSVIRTGLVVYLLRQTPLKRAKLSGLDLSGLLAFDDGLVANADDQHVQAANGHHDDGAELGVHGISQGTHDGREDGAADQAHEHQAGNLVLVLRAVHQGVGEEEREHVGVTEANQSHSHPEQGGRRVGGDGAEDGEAHGGDGHDDTTHQNADVVGDLREHDTAGESADHTGDEVDHGGGGGDFGEGVAGVFGEGARSLGVDADDQVDHKQDPPHAELGGALDGDVWGEEGCEGLDELAERQRGGEPVSLDEHGEQWVQRYLHQGVADTEEGEGDDDQHQACGAG